MFSRYFLSKRCNIVPMCITHCMLPEEKDEFLQLQCPKKVKHDSGT